MKLGIDVSEICEPLICQNDQLRTVEENDSMVYMNFSNFPLYGKSNKYYTMMRFTCSSQVQP